MPSVVGILTPSGIKRMGRKGKSNGKGKGVYCVRGVVSPLLANIYLDELDRYMERHTTLTTSDKTERRKKGKANYAYIRYADDFVILSNGTRAEAEVKKEEIYNLLRYSLKLNLSKEKTKITHINDGFKFLGFWIQRSPGHNGMKTKVDIPKEARERVLGKLTHATDKTSYRDSLNTKIQAMNRIISGWCRYYQYTSKASSVFNEIENEYFWLLAHWIGRKLILPMPEVMKRYNRGHHFGTKEYQLIKAYKEFPPLHYKKRFLKPNPYIMQEVIQREEFPEETRWTG